MTRNSNAPALEKIVLESFPLLLADLRLEHLQHTRTQALTPGADLAPVIYTEEHDGPARAVCAATACLCCRCRSRANVPSDTELRGTPGGHFRMRKPYILGSCHPIRTMA